MVFHEIEAAGDMRVAVVTEKVMDTLRVFLITHINACVPIFPAVSEVQLEDELGCGEMISEQGNNDNKIQREVMSC